MSSPGKNLLYTAQSIEEVAARSGRSADDVAAALGRIRTTLFAARERRPRPHLDDKILTAWNGLMIAAFARAARVLVHRPASEAYLAAATRAARFIRNTLWKDDRLLRRYRDGEAAIDGYAEDYAYLIWGLLELFQADGDAEWLEWALRLQRKQDETFWDPDDGGWFSTSGQDPTVLLRLKEDYDGAEPAASSVAALNTLTIAHLTGDDRDGRAGAADPGALRPSRRRRRAHDPHDAVRALRLARGIFPGRHRRSARQRARAAAGSRARAIFRSRS